MPGRVVLLRPEDRPDLEHALVNADHELLVELRALREEGLLAEVLELEQVRASLGADGDDLGRPDLGEAVSAEEAAESRRERRLDAEDCALARVPKRDRAPVQLLGQRDRKSTRLNSSHGSISYAVFCLKK